MSFKLFARRQSSVLLSFLLVLTANAKSSPLTLVSSGLQNLGNTCYLNAQLQCAFHIPRIRTLINTPASDAATELTTPDGSDETAVTEEPQQDSLPLQALRQLFAEMKDSRHRAVAPRQLCSVLGIPVMQQQDSQEFWKLLLPALKQPKLMDLYQGAYEDYIVALDGSGREKRREEAFLDLSLDVSSQQNTVQKSLAHLFGDPELLSNADGNGWRPEKGAEKVDAHKGTLLRAPGLPSILQLHLKRFNFDWTTETTSKINDPLAFPEELDLAEICTPSNGDTQTDEESLLYDLQGIVVHAGEYGSGHYYAYVRPDVTSDDWYRFNDDIVEKVDLKEVLCDGYGGSLKMDRPPTKGGFVSRLLRVFQPAQITTAGFGGSTSNAYVLQYVRRSEVPFLYET